MSRLKNLRIQRMTNIYGSIVSLWESFQIKKCISSTLTYTYPKPLKNLHTRKSWKLCAVEDITPARKSTQSESIIAIFLPLAFAMEPQIEHPKIIPLTWDIILFHLKNSWQQWKNILIQGVTNKITVSQKDYVGNISSCAEQSHTGCGIETKSASFVVAPYISI